MKFAIKPLIILVALFVGGYLFYKHSGFFLYEQNPWQYMPNMHHTKALIPQRGYSFFEDHSAARVPPAGTIARDEKPYPYTKEVSAADVPKFSNPLPATREVVERGRVVFNIYCRTCHGPTGQGDGLIVPPFSKPPSLQSDKIRGYADSQIFHIATVGQNLMGSYGKLIRESDRWAAIHYLRVLQRAENPTPEDLAAFDKVIGATPPVPEKAPEKKMIPADDQPKKENDQK